ncbi:MAG: hypothetical protein R3266_13440, partial [Gemmatimonadota bacterium]|nr:hypothetical protein [Gemmatimonadota bacterium]
MRNRSVFALLTILAGCASPAEPLPALGTDACGERLPAGSVVEMASTTSGLRQVRMGPCGEVTWYDAAGDLFVAGPELVEPERVTGSVGSVDVSRLGDQAFVRRADGATAWMRLDDPDGAV